MSIWYRVSSARRNEASKTKIMYKGWYINTISESEKKCARSLNPPNQNIWRTNPGIDQ